MWAWVREGHGPRTADWNSTNPHGESVAGTEALVASTRPTNALIDNVEILHHSQRRLVQRVKGGSGEMTATWANDSAVPSISCIDTEVRSHTKRDLYRVGTHARFKAIVSLERDSFTSVRLTNVVASGLCSGLTPPRRQCPSQCYRTIEHPLRC